MNIEKQITPFIEAQFPQFYSEEGPLFIEFMKAYYAWMQAQGNVTNESRSLLEYRDIDTTLDNFVIYFKNKYINALPENIIADKRLLAKHILDLYRAKGTDRSYALLFKIFFNEDIELYYPGKDIFKLSDGEWVIPKYIEVSSSEFLTKLIGQRIYSSSNQSTATVENHFTKSVRNKLVNVLILSNMTGNFKQGEKILCKAVPELTPENAPTIVGSLTAIGIIDGGINYTVGDVLNVNDNGSGGLARVVATTDRNGQVTFNLLDGGSGFSVDAIINVTGNVYSISSITKSNPVVIKMNDAHGFANSDTLRVDYVNGMTQINVNGYDYFAKVVNSTAISLYSDFFLETPVNSTSWGTHVANSGYVYMNPGGVGANFDIGSIVNREIFRINTDYINTYFQEIVDSTVSGFNITVENVSGTFSALNTITTANTPVLPVDVENLTIATTHNREMLTNNALEISNLTITISEDSYLLLSGSDITNANLELGTVLVAYKPIIANSTFVDSPSDTIKITNASETFYIGDQVLYVVPTGNTEISGLNANNFYYISFANNTDVALSATQNGPNVSISESRFGPGEIHQLQSVKSVVSINTKFPIVNVNCKATVVAVNSSILSVNNQTYSVSLIANSSYVDSNTNTIKLTNADFYMLEGTQVYYKVPTGNTAITGLTGNTYYFVTFANNTDFALSLTEGGANLSISESRTGAGQIHTIEAKGGYFILDSQITSNSGATATVKFIDRLTDYDFPSAALNIENMDTPIDFALTTVDKEVGTIATLKNINTGEGYSQDPTVTILEPLIYDLRMTDPNNGGYKGFNAKVESRAGVASGIVTAVEIVDSGFGYDSDQMVGLASNANPYAVKGTTVVDTSGKGKGYWKDKKSFLSDQNYLQDSYYYQKYSYEIVASRMLETYEKFVKDLVHPTGMKLFGKYLIRSEFDLEQSFVSQDEFQDKLKSFNSLTDVSNTNDFITISNHQFANGDSIIYHITPQTYIEYKDYMAAVYSNTTNINSSTNFIKSENNQFANGDLVIYRVPKNSGAINGLVDNKVYYVIQANTSGFKVSKTLNGSAVDISSLNDNSVHKFKLTYQSTFKDYYVTFDTTAGVNSSANFINVPDNDFANGNLIEYKVSEDGVPVTGLTGNKRYFVVSANSSGIKLSNSLGGSAINITALGNNTIHELRLSTPTAIGGLENHKIYYVVQANTAGIKVSNTLNGSAINLTSGYGETHSFYKLNVG